MDPNKSIFKYIINYFYKTQNNRTSVVYVSISLISLTLLIFIYNITRSFVPRNLISLL